MLGFPRSRRFVLIATVYAWLLGLDSAEAQAAGPEISYSGRLTRASGEPMRGVVTLQARFFRSETGDEEIVDLPLPEARAVDLKDGIFDLSLTLDSDAIASLFNDRDEVWIGIEVRDSAGEVTVLPRQRFQSVPYALKVAPLASLKLTSTGGGTQLKAHPDATGTTYTLPAEPVAGRLLSTDAQGQMTWVELPPPVTLPPPGSSGEMLSSVYDVAGDGLVDDAAKLGGRDAAFFMNASNLSSGTVPQARLAPATAGQPGVIKATAGYVTVDPTGEITNLHADSAGVATTAGSATTALTAVSATNATNADFATNALNATNANHALTATSATSAATASSATTAVNFSGALAGDVTGAQGTTVVSLVGGRSAAQVATSVGATLAATDVATGSTLVKRDGAGTFATAAVRLMDGDTNYVTLRGNSSMGANVTLTLPPTVGAAGQILTAADGSGTLSWTTPFTLPDVGTPGSYVQVTTDAKGRVVSGSATLPAAAVPALDTSKLTTGLLGVARGGTGAGSLTGIAIGNGTGAMSAVAASGGGLYLRRNLANTDYEFVASPGIDPTFSFAQATSQYLATDQIKALPGRGLNLTNDAGQGMVVTNGGAIGIGTNVPSEMVHLYNMTDPEGAGLKLSGNGVNVTLKSVGGTHNGLEIRNGAGVAIMKTMINGNVGIGTTIPGAKLDVFGVTRSTGFANWAQAVSLSNVSTIAANGSGVLQIQQSAGNNLIDTITGCNSGAVGQGQIVTLIATTHAGGAATFVDTPVTALAADQIVLAGAANFTLISSAATRGSSVALMCTTLGIVKAWVEVSRSVNTN